MVNLIQNFNISRFVTTYMCMCISLTNATTCRHDIQMDTVKAQSTVITEIRIYPAEGPMPRASEASFALVDIVRCSKLWTTVDAGCRTMFTVQSHERITRKKTGSESDHREED